MNLIERIEELEKAVFGLNPTPEQTMNILEDLTDRACQKKEFPLNMHLSQFTDWIRGLYPELYIRNTPQNNRTAIQEETTNSE